MAKRNEDGYDIMRPRNGFETSVFYEKCDDGIRTIVVIKLNNINRSNLSGSGNENGIQE
ncbi:hypothetical protein Glove_543g72 [Diversispora epigaea]|uniref:Uncharacterized protein n=1 Tax=Diversispora epigaea TaxID=1348612 RepID=A0A397GCE4_9GLOM|nr:hypothetical protein Glove_543g72 [Diversispora epigaea]